MTKKPLVIAHRGASAYEPENTMRSFELARRMGADGIELDIFRSRDGKIVVTHDENLKRLTGADLITRKTTLADLRGLDFGKGERIPLLDEVLEEFGKSFAAINVEIKSTGLGTDGIEEALVKTLERHKLKHTLWISSFNPFNLLRLKRLDSSLNTGYLVDPQSLITRWTQWPRLIGSQSANLENQWANPDRVARYRALGFKIWVWTVNSRADMQRWITAGADAIITNHPDELVSMVKG